VQREILEKNPNAKLKVYAVWFNMLASDDRSRWPQGLFSDPRVGASPSCGRGGDAEGTARAVGAVTTPIDKNAFDELFEAFVDGSVFSPHASSALSLSTDAGELGLNLEAASTVVNLDLPWNPAVLGQRIARAHRMGQKHTVNVINLIARGAIEEAPSVATRSPTRL